MLKRFWVVGALIGTLLAGGSTIALAAIPDSDDGEIHSCRNNITGNLRVIDQEAGQNCTAGQTELTWNQTGPQGPQGPQGEQGEQGAPGETGSLETIRVINGAGQTPAPFISDEFFTGYRLHLVALCPQGFVVTGGGYTTGGSSAKIDTGIRFNQPIDSKGGWEVQLESSNPFTLEVSAMCTPGAIQ